MKILLVATSPDTDAHHITALLQRAGLQTALPAASGITAHTWHSKLYQALDQTDPSQTQRPLTVGKVWQDMASQLLLANLDLPEWGFGNSQATWVLDFWKHIDPQTRFVLAYTPPQHLDLSAPQALNTWLAYNRELLRFYKANKQRAILVDATHISAHPLRLAHTCQKQLGLGTLDWQQLANETSLTPATHTPNPAARKLAKQLAQACTPLLNPTTALATTASAPGGKSKLAELLGIFGKTRQLSDLNQQLQRTQAEHAQTQAELEQANQLLAELAQHKQTLEQQTQTQLKETQAHKEEGELLLAQLHQVQEELEKHFLANKQSQEQLAQAKTAADKAKADLEAKLKQAAEAKVKVEADKTAADKAKAAAEKAKADLEAKLKQAAEAKVKVEADKTAADKAKAAAEKAKAEAEKAKLDATQEAELLLQQLHQVQEELENYYLKNKQLEQGAHTLQTTQDRLTRLLARLPTWADAHTLVAQLAKNEANHQALRIQAQQVWIGQNKPLPEVALLLGVQNTVPYLQLGPTPDLPNGFNTQDSAAVALLNTTQWRTVRSLLGLVPAHIARLQAVPAKDHAFWLQAVQRLGADFEAAAKHLRYDHADAITISSPAAGQETMRLALRNLEMGSYRNPLLVLDVGIHTKTTRGKTKTTHVNFDFRQWKEGAAPFAVWSPNQQDDNGQFLRISFDIAKNRLNMAHYHQLSPQDQAVLIALVQAMPTICEELDLHNHTQVLGQETWGASLLQAATLAEYELQQPAQPSELATA
jgi:hypothetical protein